MEVIRIPLVEITPDPNNAKLHPGWQIEQIKESIKQFGNLDPIGVWGEQNLIVEGHGRYLALLQLGYTEAECIRLDQLNEEERKAYALAHNKLTMNSDFDYDALRVNLDEIETIDMEAFGFESVGDWFEERERFDQSKQDGNEEYNEFLEKFEQKKTTDDCYTPDNIYDVVADWVAEKYHKRREDFVRPFYPGGNYQAFHYKPESVVVDNPPFSILAEIVDWYAEHNIGFFIFAPGLIALNYATRPTVTIVISHASVTYENNATVRTSFLTNLEDPSIVAFTAPELHDRIEEINKLNQKALHAELQVHDYPEEVANIARLGYIAEHGQRYVVKRDEATFIRALDAQKEQGGGIYGGALLCSVNAAAERAAQEKAAEERKRHEDARANRWKLSDREAAIVQALSR